MRLFLTVTEAGVTQDVAFDVSDGATIRDVARAAATIDADIEIPDYTASVDSDGPLPPDRPVVQGGLRSGQHVRLVPASAAGGTHTGGAASLTWKDEHGRTVKSFALLPGENVVGRGLASTVVVDHPSVSRSHFRLTIGEHTELVDLQSANGVTVDGRLVNGSIRLGPSAIVKAGQTVLEYRGPSAGMVAASDLSASEAGAPVTYFNRPPRTQPRYRGASFKAPAPPQRPETEPFNWAPAMVPIAMAGVLLATGVGGLGAAVTFALMSPLMLAGTWWQNRRNATRRYTRLVNQFRSDVVALEQDLRHEQETEMMARRLQAPGTPELVDKAVRLRSELWSRGIDDEDFLVVRVGQGDQPSILQIELPDGGERTERAAIENLPSRFGTVSDVPVEADLTKGGIGFAGVGESGRAAVRSLIAQITALHSPAEVVLAALLSEEEGPNWDWLKWLPHTRSPLSPLAGEHLAATPAACSDLLRRLTNVSAERGAREAHGSVIPSWIVVLIDDRARLDRPVLDAMLRHAPAVGITFIWFSGRSSDLSRRCRSVVVVDRANPVLRFSVTGSGDALQGVRADLLDVAAAASYARSLASVQDISARTAGELDLPSVVLLSELLGGEAVLHDVNQIHQLWERNTLSSRTLAAPVGLAPGEELSIDIVRQGPHGFLIGTTGSGKSELLRTLLVSLAASYGPEKVNFLLIDFKGGAALKPFLELPHTVGLVTNLAEGESNAEAKLEVKVRRTIVWLRAELQRRMTLLNDAGFSDLSDMEKRLESGGVQPPPRLIIVADEFAVLANNKQSSSTDVIDEIVNIARLGRSLGIHLLLATQRAAGVISDNIRANTNLRIALRVQDVSESNDVVGSPDAARISLATPGRAFVSVGAGNLTEVQTASSTGHSSALKLLPKVNAERFTFLGKAPTAAAPSALPSGAGDNDLALLARNIRLAGAHWRVPQPDTHWAEPPAEVVPLSSVPHTADPFALTLGLVDFPDQQVVSPLTIDLSSVGSVLAFGTGRSGKTVLLRTAAASFAQRFGPDDVRMYTFDCAGRGLEVLSSLPQVAGSVSGDDTEFAYRLFRELRQTIDRRLELFSGLGVSDLAEYRHKVPVSEDRYVVVVLIDGLTSFIERYQNIDGGLLVDRLGALLLDGRAAGVHFVMTANRRGGIPMAVMSAVSEQLILRMANPDEYSMLDVKPTQTPIEPAPGHGLYKGFEFQTALVTNADHAWAISDAVTRHDEVDLQVVAEAAQAGDAQAAALQALGAWLTESGWSIRDEQRLRRLPTAAVPHGAQAALRPWQASIGLGDLRLEPAILNFAETHAVITGPPRSGRSSLLATTAASLAASTPRLSKWLIGSRRSPASSSGVFDHVYLADADAADALHALASRIRANEVEEPTLVCLDDYSDLDDALVGGAFSAAFGAAKRGAPVRFMLASEPRALMGNWNEGAKAIRRFRTGVLLQPDIDADGDILSARLPRQLWQQYGPGRGFLVQGNSVQLIQAWTPGERPPW
jgi:DNA segregation ATPase FtsK/SpoIIIE, S-DNA-T family